MKIRYIILIIFCGFMLQTTYAQQANRMIRGSRGYIPPPSQTNGTYVELKNPQHELELIMPKCTAAFGMDAFQQEIFKNLLVAKIEDENNILSDDKNTRDIRKKLLITRNNEFHRELTSILTSDQVEEFKLMDFSETKEEKKEKKKRNRKKNKKTKS